MIYKNSYFCNYEKEPASQLYPLVHGGVSRHHLLFRHDNLIRWIKAGFTIRKQEKQIEWYNKEIVDLDKQIEAMSTDRDTLEKYARETFLFAEPGDDVYLIPDDTK